MSPAEISAYVTPILSGANLAVLVLVLYRVTELEKDLRSNNTHTAKLSERLVRVESKLEDVA
jgi:hypothetical protein